MNQPTNPTPLEAYTAELDRLIERYNVSASAKYTLEPRADFIAKTAAAAQAYAHAARVEFAEKLFGGPLKDEDGNYNPGMLIGAHEIEEVLAELTRKSDHE